MSPSSALSDPASVSCACLAERFSILTCRCHQTLAGAIPPIAEQQSMWWTAWLTGKMPSLPSSPSNYYLLSPPTARIKYGVDHTTYMHTLASDFGGSPALSDLVRTHGLFVTVVYCFSAAFTSHYRLLGPFRSDKAPQVVKTEIWETVTRRGLLGNLYVHGLFLSLYSALRACHADSGGARSPTRVNLLALIQRGPA